MNDFKKIILEKICYTDLVFERINKKLNIELSIDKIEEMIYEIIKETDKTEFRKTGKNIYITNKDKNVRLTINSCTNRIITADILYTKNEPPTSCIKHWGVKGLFETFSPASAFATADRDEANDPKPF